jgi:hypothetical protein
MLITHHPPANETGLLSSIEPVLDHRAAPTALPPSLVAALREPAILIAAAEWTLARDLLAVPVPVLAIEQTSAEGVIVHVDGQRIPLPALPPLCLAAIAFTDEGAEALQAAIEAAPGGDAGPLVTRMQPGDALGLAIAVVAGSSGLLRRQAALLANSLRSLGQLRATHDDQQQRLAALEAFIARDNRQDFDCVFDESPAIGEDTTLRIGTDANLRRLTQLLPVASRGVSAIALHLARTPLSPQAVVQIRLTSLEDGLERASWRLAASSLRPGWQVLGVDRAISGLARTLSLSVEVAGGTLAFSLGGPQPLPGFRVAGEDGAALAPRSLAFKVWTGLPGVLPPLTAIDRLAGADDLGQGYEDIRLTPEAIELTRDGATTTRAAFDDDSLPCDPAREGITLGRLPGALRPGTLVVQALGRVLGGAAEAVEFALAASPSANAALALAGIDGPAAGWSGWTAVEADGTAKLRLFLAAGEAAAQDLHILTRQTSPGGGTPPRARIAGLRATIDAVAAGAHRAAPTGPGEQDAAPTGETLVPARDFRGSGFHALEGSGEHAWRWLGAEATLRLADIPRQARRIEILIAAAAPGLAEGSIACTINGTPTEARFTSSAESGLAAVIEIPPVARRRDRSLLLQLAFGRAHQPAGDSRVLSLACTGLRIGG